MLATRRNREGGSFFVAAPDDWGEMKFGEVRGGESRARRTLRRSRKPCQGYVNSSSQNKKRCETPVEFESFGFGHQQVFCLFTVFE